MSKFLFSVASSREPGALASAFTIFFRPLGKLLFLLSAGWLAALAPAAEVAVDVGHTLAAPGAISARGMGELEFNQALARALVPA